MEVCVTTNGAQKGENKHIATLLSPLTKVVEHPISPFSCRRKLPPCPTCRTKASRRESCNQFFCRKCSSSFAFAIPIGIVSRNDFKADALPLVHNAAPLPSSSSTYQRDTQDSTYLPTNATNPPTNSTNPLNSTKPAISRSSMMVAYHYRRKINNHKIHPNKLENNNYHHIHKTHIENKEHLSASPHSVSQTSSSSIFSSTNNISATTPWSSRRKNKQMVLPAKRDEINTPKPNNINEDNDSDTEEEEDPFDAPAYSYLDALYEDSWQKFHDDKLQAGVTITMFAKPLFLKKLKQHANRVAAGLPTPPPASMKRKRKGKGQDQEAKGKGEAKHHHHRGGGLQDDDFDGTKIRFKSY